MEKKGKYLGSWELGCMVFNVCLHKMFTAYPRRFGVIGGSAGWLTALYTGILFLGALFVLLTLMRRREAAELNQRNGSFGRVICVFLAVFWLASAVYTLRETIAELRALSYARSPAWFLTFFLMLGAASAAAMGARAVYRMHSLTVLFVGLAAAGIAGLGFGKAEPLYLAPVLGTGAGRVFGEGLSALLLYADVLFLPVLIPRCRPEVKVRKTAMLAGTLAVGVNVALMLAVSMSRPGELAGAAPYPVYPLANTAYFGKFWSRMDAVYLSAFILSQMLFLSLALHLIAVCLRRIRPHSLKGRSGKAAGAVFCLALCLLLPGCYDGREPEEGAYLIALGIDKGEREDYCYTFQLSNPLESGENLDATGMGGQQEGEEKQEDGEEEKGPKRENKTVNNVVLEADDFYSALNLLKGYLSKQPTLSHLKGIVFSKAAAEEGVMEHAALLFREREVRPAVNLCLADSAREFLSRVKPTLEQSTARYYELFFRNKNTPYAPVTDLQTFVARGCDGGWDPVLPVADGEKLMGMGIFRNDVLTEVLDGEEALLYRLMMGEARHAAVRAGASSFSVTGKGRPEIRLTYDTNPPGVSVGVSLEAELIYGNPADSAILAAELEEKMTRLLQKTLGNAVDLLGVGGRVRADCLTQQQWENLNWREKMKEFTIFTKTNIKIGRNVENLQKK